MNEDLRIQKIIDYVTDLIKELNSDYLQVNADWLGIEASNYSVDKVPVDSNMEKWIIPCFVKRDVYTLRTRENYSSDVINNLQNIGFFEKLERKINSNNSKGIRPKISGIESITCLTAGALNSVDPSLKTAEFSIQVQITYREVVYI